MIVLSYKQECCGCSACLAVCPKQCIRMAIDDKEGFLYPVTDEKSCIDCGLCEKVCPCLHPGTPKEPIQSYASIHRDESIRYNSSSGGLFTALAEETIRNGGVVFGARFDEFFNVIHDYTETLEGLSVFRGSKYVQSDMRNSFRQAEHFLKEGREVLFSGVSCQIAGLKAFLRKEYEHLFTLDILCHGVASPAVWGSFLHAQIVAQKQEAKQLTHVVFRDKKNGWKLYDFCLRFTEKEERLNKKRNFFATSKERIASKEIRLNRKTNPYMVGYFADLYLRPSCYYCPRRDFSAGSDLTLGDCWGIEKQPPQPYCADDKGVSLVMVHTQKGVDRMQQIDVSIERTPIDYHTVERYNPAIHYRPVWKLKRERFFIRWRMGEGFNKVVASLTRPTFTKRIETMCTPLLEALGIKGFTKRLRK